MIIEDNGSDSRAFRAARSFDATSGAPVLHVEYDSGGGGFQQDGNGLVSMEAEHFQANPLASDGHRWMPAGSGFPGCSGLDALQSLPEDTVTHSSGYASTGARLDYPVKFVQSGLHYVWVRARGPLTRLLNYPTPCLAEQGPPGSVRSCGGKETHRSSE